MDAETVAAVARLLEPEARVLFVTGAGLSAASGLPTYRGTGGLYEGSETEDGVPIEVALSGETLLARPELAWRHLRRIEEACRGARPNRGHEVIALLESRAERAARGGAVVVLTQNVDGFHRAAGSRNVIDIHGDVHRIGCTRGACGWEEEVADYARLPPLPRCPNCGAVARPRVVLFGEMLPEDRLLHLDRELGLGFDVVFSVGTSSLFPYIAGPIVTAARMGIPTVEINPGPTEVSFAVRHRLRADAARALDAVWRAVDGAGSA